MDTYLSAELDGLAKELRARTHNYFVYVVSIAAAGDNEIAILAGGVGTITTLDKSHESACVR